MVIPGHGGPPAGPFDVVIERNAIAEMIPFDPVTAANRARLAYSAYVGFIQLAQIGQPRMSHEEFEAYIRDFIEILIPR